MHEELTEIHKRNTWTLVALPPGSHAIPCKWVYKLKPINTTHARLKARLVACGYYKKHGIDFFDTFAPVVKWSTLLSITTIPASQGWTTFHMDVDTTFLNSKLTELIFMKQPPGFAVPGSEHLVCQLNNSLYCLKQSSWAWYTTLDAILRTLGWHHSSFDTNLYFFATLLPLPFY